MILRVFLASLMILSFGSQSLALSVNCDFMVKSQEPRSPYFKRPAQASLVTEVATENSKSQITLGDVLISLDSSADVVDSESNLIGYIEVRDKRGIMIYAALRNAKESTVFGARNERHQVDLSCSTIQ